MSSFIVTPLNLLSAPPFQVVVGERGTETIVNPAIPADMRPYYEKALLLAGDRLIINQNTAFALLPFARKAGITVLTPQNIDTIK